VTGILITRRFVNEYEARIEEVASQAGLSPRLLVVENEIGATLMEMQRGSVEVAFLSSDLQRGNTQGFMASVMSSPNLRWLQSFGVGVDAQRLGPLVERGVRITNAVGVNSIPVAHHALTGLLMLARRFPHYLEGQRRREWRPINWDSALSPPDLSTQTMVIVGLGAVGAEIARVARVLGLKVIGVRRRARTPEDPVDELVTPEALDSVLPQADWLVLSSVLTPETRGLITRERLQRLPAGAHLINVSRGALVDEAAVIEALREGRLAGAYLDVMSVEPLPPQSPLWDMPNVIISPHNAAVSRGKFAREADLFLRNLLRWGKREPLINEVTLAVG
jgi:phosphoglycerate dehydrogenase-like enzyme